MATLTSDELVRLRRAVASGEYPSWTKAEINVVFQVIEDELDVLDFDAALFVDEVVRENAKAQKVQDAVAARTISADILPVIEDWLADNPPSVTVRSMDTQGIIDWASTNISRFAISPPPQRAALSPDAIPSLAHPVEH